MIQPSYTAPQGIVKLEHAGVVGLRTGLLYIASSLVATVQGVAVYSLVRPLLAPLHVRGEEWERGRFTDRGARAGWVRTPF